MIHLDKDYIEKNGGLLHALSKKSADYIWGLLKVNGNLKSVDYQKNRLDRTIAHSHPHLDEYFADLLFRSWLPKYKRDIDFMEMSVHSLERDSTCEAYWPNAAVMGIGGMMQYRPKTQFLFDEHKEKGKDVPSCSQLVADTILKKRLPRSINTILQEVNEIDSAGGANTQHIGNIMKTAHQVRFMFKAGEEFHQSEQNWLTPEWKKSLVDASITAVIYCLEQKIDLLFHQDDKSKEILLSLEHYLDNCPYQKDAKFPAVVKYLKSTYGNQSYPYITARLPLTKKRYQILIIGRIYPALRECWGNKIASIIMMHFWEVIYQGQATFENTMPLLEQLKQKPQGEPVHTKYGILQKHELLSKVTPDWSKLRTVPKNFQENLWVLSVDETPMFVQGNRPLINFLNRENRGFGFLFINNDHYFTKAIFCGNSVPYDLWEKLVDKLCQKEPECWHKSYRYNSKTYASFLINGNRSHQYVPRSEVRLKDFISVIEKLTET